MCASVCLIVYEQNMSKSYEFFYRTEAWPEEQSFRFWWRYGSPYRILRQFFTTVTNFQRDSKNVVYYYSPGGSSSLGGGMRSTECSRIVIWMIRINCWSDLPSSFCFATRSGEYRYFQAAYLFVHLSVVFLVISDTF